ncbi:MAG: hypothetical protein J6T06_08960, partial [Victivallales bacterium]|nr:hypothetical protein [Victivallales bacterium]
ANADGSVEVNVKDDTQSIDIVHANVKNVFSVTTAGDVRFTSDINIPIADGIVKAASVNVDDAAKIVLAGANIAADAGNVDFMASNNMTLEGDNKISASGDAIFRADIFGDGSLDITAANIGFTGELVNLWGSDTKITATANTLGIAPRYFRANVIDLSGVNQVVLNNENVYIGASKLTINNVLPGIAKDEDGNDVEILSDLHLAGDDQLVLGGDVRAQNIVIDGDAIVLQNDISIIAESGSDENKVYGGVTLGNIEGDVSYITGTHDLTVRGGNIDILSVVDVKNLSITAKASSMEIDGEVLELPGDVRLLDYGITMSASNDLIIDADGDIILNNSTFENPDENVFNDIYAGNNLVLTGNNVTVAGGVAAGNGFTVTAAETATINASKLDNGVINAGSIVLGEKNEGEGLAIGQNGDVLFNSENVTVTNGTDVAASFGKPDVFADIDADTLIVNNATNLSLDVNAAKLAVANADGSVEVNVKDDTQSIDIVHANVKNVFSVTTAGDVRFTSDINIP